MESKKKKENIGIVIKDNEINSIVDAINLVFKKKISSINTSSLKKNYSWKSITSKTEEVLLA